MKSTLNLAKLLVASGLVWLASSSAFGSCDPMNSGMCCIDWYPNGQCLEEVECSSCNGQPEPTPTPDPEPLPDEPFPYPNYPSCGDMGAC